MAADMTRPPQDPLPKVIGFARNHRSGLEVCLPNPDVPVDTNRLYSRSVIKTTSLDTGMWPG